MAKKLTMEKARPAEDEKARFYEIVAGSPIEDDEDLHALLSRSHYLSDEERVRFAQYLTRENLARFPDLERKFRFMFDKGQLERFFPRTV